MTIVVGAIVKPKGKRKPFFIMGSDTRRKCLIDGEIVQFDDQEKIYKFNSMFLGIAGALPDDFFHDLSSTIKSLGLTFDLSCEWLQREVKKYLDDYGFLDGIDYWRVRMILGAVEDNIPKMAVLEYDTRDKGEMICKKYNVEKVDRHIEFIGNTIKTQIEQVKVRKRFSGVKNIIETKSLIKDFMVLTSKRYPDECNTLFNFEIIEGD